MAATVLLTLLRRKTNKQTNQKPTKQPKKNPTCCKQWWLHTSSVFLADSVVSKVPMVALWKHISGVCFHLWLLIVTCLTYLFTHQQLYQMWMTLTGEHHSCSLLTQVRMLVLTISRSKISYYVSRFGRSIHKKESLIEKKKIQFYLLQC